MMSTMIIGNNNGRTNIVHEREEIAGKDALVCSLGRPRLVCKCVRLCLCTLRCEEEEEEVFCAALSSKGCMHAYKVQQSACSLRA